MPITRRAKAAGSLGVTRISESAWVLRPTGPLEDHAVAALRDAFLEAVDSGAESLLVDLSHVATVDVGGAAMLLAMADLTRGRSGRFWLAARWSNGAGHTLRAIDEDGPEALLGVSAALDAALEQLPLEVPWHGRSDCT